MNINYLNKPLNILYLVFIILIFIHLILGIKDNKNNNILSNTVPLKEVFFINLEQFADGTFYLQYSIEGKIESTGFSDWNRYLEYKEYLSNIFIINEVEDIYQHGVDKLDINTALNNIGGK